MQAKAQAQHEQQKKVAQMEEKKQEMMRQLLQPEARERLNRIALVKKATADQVFQTIMSRYERGLVSTRLNDKELQKIINQILPAEKPGIKITFQRKRYMEEDDDDDINYDEL